MPGAGDTGEQGTGGLCPLGTQSSGRVRQTGGPLARFPTPIPREDILFTVLEREGPGIPGRQLWGLAQASGRQTH